MQTKSKTKLTSKDLITIAIFSVLFAVIYFAGAMTMGMIPATTPLTILVGMIPNGIIWCYLRTKVQKPLSIFVQCVLLALMLFLFGATLPSLSALISAFAAEFVARIGKYKGFGANTAAYAVMGAVFNLAAFGPALLSASDYYDLCISQGMDVAYVDKMMTFMSPGIILLSTLGTMIAAVVGMYLGKIMLKKHFIKAGIA